MIAIIYSDNITVIHEYDRTSSKFSSDVTSKLSARENNQLSTVKHQLDDDATKTTGTHEPSQKQQHSDYGNAKLEHPIQVVHDKYPEFLPRSDQLKDQSVQKPHLRGFALCYSYYEQQTNALSNMWSFQKWAKESGSLSVVEPFASNSVLEFPKKRGSVQPDELASWLRFRDYFDIDHWTKESAKYGIPPFITWETFIRYSSKKVVLIILTYQKPPSGFYVNEDIKNHAQCNKELEIFNNRTKNFLIHFHFEVIKTVCYASCSRHSTLEDFNSHLVVESQQKNLTYWFYSWHGVGRIKIQSSIIGRGGSTFAMARPSPRILQDSKNYVKTVLGLDSNKYAAVAFRTQPKKNAMESQRKSRNEIMNYFLKCAEGIATVLSETKMNDSILAIDLGRFGDLTALNYYDYDGKGSVIFQTALDAVYHNKTIAEYHEDFITAANGITDSGYIGAMQKNIAEKAECLIVIGGHSNFQRSMISNHRSTSNCIKYLCYG